MDPVCFCINLDDRPDKWAATKEAFSGLAIERFSAIRHTEGWKGCGASHVAIAREAMRRGLPWVLVLEDDCQPAPDFAERWPVVRDALLTQSSWDIFLGGPTYVQGPIKPKGPHLYEIDRGFALHFYVLNAIAYEKAIAWNPDRHGPIDVYYSNQYRVVTTYPLLATQRPSLSDIKKEDRDYSDHFEESDQILRQLIYAFHTRDGTIALLLISGLLLTAIWH